MNYQLSSCCIANAHHLPQQVQGYGFELAVDIVRDRLWHGPKPGFQEILIRPQTETVSWAKGRMSTPLGLVHVEWRKDPASGKISFRADTPRGVPVRVELPGQKPKVYPRGGLINVTGASR